MKRIEDYIQFAIDNHLKIDWWVKWDIEFIIQWEYWDMINVEFCEKNGPLIVRENLKELITSKEFIDAIYKWLKNCENTWWNASKHKNLKDFLTYKQSIAIRENTLNEFIWLIFKELWI